jgi:N utilization substance protein A
MQVVVPNDQLSLAIGKRGQNVRLAAKLTHWKIDIMSEDEADADFERLEALRRAEMAFSLPKRLSVFEGAQKTADEDANAAGAVTEMPETVVEDAEETADEDANAAVGVDEMSELVSEDSMNAAGTAEVMPSAGSTLSPEQSVDEATTDIFEETLLDRDDPERSDESEI